MPRRKIELEGWERADIIKYIEAKAKASDGHLLRKLLDGSPPLTLKPTLRPGSDFKSHPMPKKLLRLFVFEGRSRRHPAATVKMV